MLNRPKTVNINDKVQNIDDNHFSYTNPVCPHCFKEKRRDEDTGCQHVSSWKQPYSAAAGKIPVFLQDS